MAEPFFPGQHPEDLRIIGELAATGPEGRPATVPTRQDLGFSGIVGGVSRKLSRAARIMQGQEQEPLKQMEQLLTVAKAFQDFGADPAGAAQWLAQSAKEANLDLPPELFSNALASPTGISALAAKFPEIMAIPAASRRKLLSDPTFLRNLLEEGKKTGEERRKFALEQGYTAEQAEEYATSGKLPTGATPKALGETRKEDLSIAVKDELRAAGVDPKTANSEQIKSAKDAVDKRLLQRSREQGAEAVARQPLPETTAKSLSELNALLEQMADVERLFKPEFVGPIHGRVAGVKEATTGKLSDEEIEMRATVKDMQDALLRARSGAQINEQEYKRLVAFLPDLNTMPNVFKARLNRFRRAVKTVIEEKSKFATTSRGELEGGPVAGAGQPIPLRDYMRR